MVFLFVLGGAQTLFSVQSLERFYPILQSLFLHSVETSSSRSCSGVTSLRIVLFAGENNPFPLLTVQTKKKNKNHIIYIACLSPVVKFHKIIQKLKVV